MKLKALRETRELTQEQVAEAIDVRQDRYSQIERGMVPTDIALMYRIADFFGVTVYDLWPRSLFQEPGDIPEVPTVKSNGADNDKG